MCGISALFSLVPRPMAGLIAAMNGLVVHRGPDGCGTEVFSAAHTDIGALRVSDDGAGQLALGHTRLAIVDLSPLGHQPMASMDGRYWITYNGEIYNHDELRQELAALGDLFRSRTDTEVILAAYARWGAACLQRFNGMFAFVLIDRVTKRIFVARDRFGVKPLYYWRSPDCLLALASEIKQFSVLPGWQPRLNGQRAYDFLNWGLFDHTRETLFSGVGQLRGGECIEAHLDDMVGDFTIRTWYRLEATQFQGDMPAAALRFGELLEDSIRLRLRADVPVGSCLSGGLDSSSIVCLAARLLHARNAGSRQHTFSARSSVKRYDEGDYIAAVVAETDVTSHETVPPLDELFETLPQLTWHQDEPFASTSIYAQWHVFRLAKVHGVKVMLDGQGADELLAGYHGYFGPRLAGLLRRGRLFALSDEIAAMRRLHNYSPAFAIKVMSDMLLPDRLRQYLRQVAGKSSAAPVGWLDMELLGASPGDPYLAAGARTGVIADLSRSQLLNTHLPMLLHWEDRDSMAHSVEARVPFLDYRLVEFALGLPEEFKLRQGVTKLVLRESMRGTLPERIRQRMDKLGFVTPEEIWLRQQAPDAFRKAMGSAVEKSNGVLRPAAIDELEDVIAGRKPFSALPWRIISFGAWMDRFQVSV
jgi:asparagine synthase (glutamine-hydrolysing)